MRQKPPTYQVYRFGEGYTTGRAGTPVHGYGYTVHYTPDHPTGSFFMAEGDARNGNGGFVRPEDLVKPLWRSHLEITGTLWLLPLLERDARGETVSPAEYLDAYTAANGSPPPTDAWGAYGN